MRLKDQLAKGRNALAGLDDDDAREEVPTTLVPVTAPGRMLSHAIEQNNLAKENAELKKKLDAFGDASPVREIAEDLIDPNPYQPRREFKQESIEDLAASISENGLKHPITVRPTANGRYILVAGERRLRAIRHLRRPTIPAFIDVESDNARAALWATTENVAREALCGFEQFLAFTALLREQFVANQVELARKVGVSRSHVVFILSYGRMPERALKVLEAKPSLIGPSSAQALANLAQEHPEYVSEAVELLGKGELTTEASTIDWVVKRVRPASTRDVLVIKAASGAAVFDVRKKERQLVIALAKEMKPDRLKRVSAKIEKILQEEAER